MSRVEQRNAISFALMRNDGNLLRTVFFRSELIFSRSRETHTHTHSFRSSFKTTARYSVVLFNPLANGRFSPSRRAVIQRALNRLLNYREIPLTTGVIAIYEAT